MSTSPTVTENTNQTTTGVTTWAIDPAHTSVEFSVRHLMISTVKGRFTDVSGTVVINEAAPAQSTAELTIKVASLDTRVNDRDAHLRSADFFDAENHPTLTFRSTGLEGSLDDSFKLRGDLTIRGTTKPIVLDVTAEGQAKDPWGGERRGYSLTTKVKRSDYGLHWNQLLETGGAVVGDEIKITIDAELLKQA